MAKSDDRRCRVAAFEDHVAKNAAWPKEHAFATDYRRLASTADRSADSDPVPVGAFGDTEPLAIDFPNGRVIVQPDEMAELANGTVILRRVRTGQKRSNEYDRLDYTLYQLAGESHFGRGFDSSGSAPSHG